MPPPINNLLDALRRKQQGLDFLTPGFNPNAPSGIRPAAPPRSGLTMGATGAPVAALSTPVAPAPATAPAPAVPPALAGLDFSGAGNPPVNFQPAVVDRTDPVAAGRQDYLAQGRMNRAGQTTWKQKLLRVLSDAGQGFLAGAARAQGGDLGQVLGSGIGGAAALGTMSGVRPELADQAKFSLFHAPQLQQEEEQGQERTRRALQVEQAKAQAEMARQRPALEAAKLALDEQQWQAKLAQAEAAQQRQAANDQFNRADKDRNYELRRQQAARTPAEKLTEGQLNDEAEFGRLSTQDGKTVEEIAQESAANDPDGVKRYMPERYYQIATGQATASDDEETVKAQQALLAARDKLFQEKLKGAQSNAQKFHSTYRATRRGQAARPASRGGAPEKRVVDPTRYFNN